MINNNFQQTLLAAALASALFSLSPAVQAGGILLYEVGTADVGLAAAGYAARAQDASTVLTNPAGMTRLSGNQTSLGAQMLHGDVGFSIGDGTSAALGNKNGGNPVGWFPGGGAFYTHSLSQDLKLGLAVTGNFGSATQYEDGWVGRYRAQEGKLLGVSLLPSLATRINDKLSLGASLNLMYGMLDNKVAVNNIIGSDGSLTLKDNSWGAGANLGLMYEVDAGRRFGLTYTSPVKLNFKAQAQWSDLAPGVRALLNARGLLDTQVDLGVTVPQGLMASTYQQIAADWALLGSVGWQQWSKFGEAEIGIDSNNPVGLSTQLPFRDTWHLSVGTQYKWSPAWLLNAGIGYDSGFQRNGQIALALPVNATWRFGVGGQKEESSSFNWGWSLEYTPQGTLRSNAQGTVPVVLGGRGNVIGQYDKVSFIFLALNFNWKS
jgi:long-chain fatty acid transport protein